MAVAVVDGVGVVDGNSLWTAVTAGAVVELVAAVAVVAVETSSSNCFRSNDDNLSQDLLGQ